MRAATVRGGNSGRTPAAAAAAQSAVIMSMCDYRAARRPAVPRPDPEALITDDVRAAISQQSAEEFRRLVNVVRCVLYLPFEHAQPATQAVVLPLRPASRVRAATHTKAAPGAVRATVAKGGAA